MCGPGDGAPKEILPWEPRMFLYPKATEATRQEWTWVCLSRRGLRVRHAHTSQLHGSRELSTRACRQW
jgi:hypothetical protein